MPRSTSKFKFTEKNPPFLLFPLFVSLIFPFHPPPVPEGMAVHDLDHMSPRIEPPGEIVIKSLIADISDKARSMRKLGSYTESTDIKETFKKYNRHVHTLCRKTTSMHELNKRQRTEIDCLLFELGEAHDAALDQLPPS